MANTPTPAQAEPLTVIIDEDGMHAAMSDMYNSGYFDLITTDGTTVRLVSGTQCDECRAGIPDVPLEVIESGRAPLANKHHATSCSLYDPNGE